MVRRCRRLFLIFLLSFFSKIRMEIYSNHQIHSQFNVTVMEVSSKCDYPCRCAVAPKCSPGTALIRDGCGCCWQCARQENDPCDAIFLCDSSKDLACVYQMASNSAGGFCRVLEKLKCSVNNQSFQDGETFLLDCRTQCTCKNGTYACVSLCPTESIHPSLFCKEPHLITVPGQCCREWRCKSKPDDSTSNPCEPRAGRWGDCSAQSCGLGTSQRWYLDSYSCKVKYESRLCQMRPCRNNSLNSASDFASESRQLSRRHHVRRSHLCRATQRFSTSVRLRVGSCLSDRKFRPKFCGSCSGFNCSVFTATTISVLFVCPLHGVPQVLQEELQLREEEPKNFNVYDVMDEGQPTIQETQRNPDLDSIKLLFKYRDKVISQNFFSSSDKEYREIVTDDHDKVTHKVQWIMRCHCSENY